MTTSFSPRGSAITVLRAYESVFGTPPITGYVPVNIYKSTLAEKQPFSEDPLLGQARNNNRDPLAPAPGLPVLQGDVDVPLDLAQLGYWLKDLFGAPSTSGSSPNFVHAFGSGGEAVPSMTIENKLNTAQFLQYAGLTASKFSVDIGAAAGNDQATFSYVGRIENPLTASAAGTPGALASPVPLPKSVGTVKLDGVAAGSVMSCKLDYDNGIKPQLFVGDNRPVGMDLDNVTSCKATIAMRMRDSTYYSLAKPIAPALIPGTHTLELLWQLSSARSLSILMNAVRIEPDGIPIDGPGGLQFTASCRCEQTSSLPMLTVTLKSPTASFV